MASGRGSNFQALIDATESGEIPDADLAHLIVNKKDAYAIKRAKKHRINYTVITSHDKTRRKFDNHNVQNFLVSMARYADSVSYTHLTLPTICSV